MSLPDGAGRITLLDASTTRGVQERHQPMALTAGTRLGPYAITGSIGAGGMGGVYRGTDTNLDRQVAIRRLLMVKENDQTTSATQISVVLNWTRELVRKVSH